MSGAVLSFMAADHERLDALLRRAVADERAIDPTAFAQFRGGLLRHIAMEEKVLLPFARQRRGGVPLEIATRLRAEHGAIAKLLVPSPTHAGCAALAALLAAHNALEESDAATGLYAAIDALTAGDEEHLLAQLRAQPGVPMAPHYDGPAHLLHRRTRHAS